MYQSVQCIIRNTVAVKHEKQRGDIRFELDPLGHQHCRQVQIQVTPRLEYQNPMQSIK